MRITALETLRPAFQKNLCVVVLHTDEGIQGIGDVFFQSHAVESYLHDHVARLVVGQSDPSPERIAALLAPYVGFQGGGVEIRANGAVDIALWDLLGKAAGLSVAQVLGGPMATSIPVYNTCAGPEYIQETSRQVTSNWGVGQHGELEDLQAFLDKPGELAKDLYAEGLRGMKVWPFDAAAEASHGTRISVGQLDRALAVVGEIRDAVGFEMDLMVELHGLWSQRMATQICRELAPFKPFWVEDPIRADSIDALATLSDQVDVPLATGETVVGRRGFLPLLQRAHISYATLDVQWTGGITEARKVAVMADAFSTAVAPHDCTGPVTLAACFHLAAAQPNAVVQETVRAYLRTWYPRVVTGLPEISDGTATFSTNPGLGLELHPDLRAATDTRRRFTELAKS